MNNKCWYFPVNAEGGQPEGLNDSGVENFRGNQIESLAREIIQNSTDAKLKDNNDPVRVTFQKQSIPTIFLPNKDGLINAFRSCLEYKRTPDQAKKFFEKGYDILHNNEISFLKISDYNTTGLLGVHEEGSDWENLVKSIGISNKGGGAGGSFGIGKSAPFACSYLRTIFYSTLNKNGEEAFQGVSRLASHQGEDHETRGTGFYGIKKNTQPITKDIPSQFRRKVPGTDVYVSGFLSDLEWDLKIIKAVLENFFLAIQEGKLLVEVNNTIISQTTLKALIDQYIKEDKNCFSNEYFSALIFGERYSTEFDGLGSVDLYLKKDEDFSKKVAMARNTGMKITHMQNFRGGIRFSGVLIIRGREFNDLLRLAEPPAHDKWEPSRYEEDPVYAERCINNLRKFVRDTVSKLNKVDEATRIDFKGLNRFLPDYLNEEDPLDNSKNENEMEREIPKSMKVTMRRNKKSNIRHLSTASSGRKKGEQPKKTKKKKSIKENKNKSKNMVEIDRIRSIVVDPSQGIYDIKIVTVKGGSGKVRLNYIGEDSKSYEAEISSAIELDGSSTLALNEGFIGPITFEDNSIKILRVSLNEKVRSSLEVIVHES